MLSSKFGHIETREDETELFSMKRILTIAADDNGWMIGSRHSISSLALANIWSSIASVSRPVKVFCWLGW